MLLAGSLACANAGEERIDLDTVRKNGVLRHLGVPYANFVSGDGQGMSCDLIRLFAQRIGVDYQYVETSWSNVIGDLVGQKVSPDGENIHLLGETPVRGDIISNGLTVLPWRQKVLNYSKPTFPTGVWLIASSTGENRPIVPSGNMDEDISNVKKKLKGKSVVGIKNTCLDPSLYDISATGADVRYFQGSMNDLAPMVIGGDIDYALLDVPDALVALEKWPGKTIVIGPVSQPQLMGVAFRKESLELQAAFDSFLTELKANGEYAELMKQYYPSLSYYFPDFISGQD